MCVLKKTGRGRQETTLFPVLFHYEYFKILLLYFKKYLGFKNLRLLRKMRKQTACCIVTKSNSIFFKRSLANMYYLTSLLPMPILWNKMYQEFCCYSNLKVTMLRRKRRMIILSNVTPELRVLQCETETCKLSFGFGNEAKDPTS